MIKPRDAARELLRRRAARSNLIGYARFIDVPGAPVGDDDTETFLPAETELAQHHELILSATQRCIERHSGRTMLFLPPGSAKSTYATVVAPTWIMGARPGFKTIAVSYGTDLARKFGRRMRSIVKQPAFQKLFDASLSLESGAAHEWALTNGSEFMGGGILSGVTGNRADFIPIDDPIKGRQDADSETVRKSTLSAYQEDVLTRLKPGGSVMLTQTRWHQDDLAGSILPEKWAGESGMIECRDGNTWDVICVPAKCDRPDDPLGRSVGDYIWPEWFPEDHWKPFEAMRRTWSALYQQRPVPDDGNLFRANWWQYLDVAPPIEWRSIYADTAQKTKESNDFSVFQCWGRSRAGQAVLLDMARGKWEAPELLERARQFWAKQNAVQGQGALRSFKVEDKVSGTGLIQQLKREGLPVLPIKRIIDKITRAYDAAPFIESGNVILLRGVPHLSDMMTEAEAFPNGAHDDTLDPMMDAVSDILQGSNNSWEGTI